AFFLFIFSSLNFKIMFQLIGSYVPWSMGLPVITTVYFIPSSGKYVHISSKQIFISNTSGIYKIPF
ncbi:MAG: hypothetical protein ACKVOW_13685, partial [Chitinophagaceae bacterium]